MADINREDKVSQAFVQMSSTLVNEYDVVDLLSSLVYLCTDILGVDAGGILLADVAQDLELVASTSEEAEVVQVMVVAAGVGPCIDCFATGLPVSIPDLDTGGETWPQFRRTALDQGFRSAHVTPLRLHGEIFGAMNLMAHESGALSHQDAQLAQALADVATVGILHERNFHEPGVVSAQLHLALDTRIMVEQAKGVLAQQHSFTMSEAFAALREYARANTMTLRAAADGIIARTISIDEGTTATV